MTRLLPRCVVYLLLALPALAGCNVVTHGQYEVGGGVHSYTADTP